MHQANQMNNILTPDYLTAFVSSNWTLTDWETACRSNLEHEFKKKRMTKQDYAIALGAVAEVVALVKAKQAQVWEE